MALPPTSRSPCRRKSRIFRPDPHISSAELTAAVTVTRAVIDVPRIFPFEAGKAIVARSTADKIALIDAMLTALSRPTAEKHPSKEGLLAVFPFPSASESEMQALITAIRTICDLQRISPPGRNAVAVNGTPGRIAAAEWILRQLWPRAGSGPAADASPYPMEANSVALILRLEPKWSDRDLAAAVTAIRLFTNVQRLYPFEGRALLARASSQELDFVEWLLHEVSAPPDIRTIRQTTTQRFTDGAVRLFATGKQVDVTPLINQIVAILDLRTVVPLPDYSAVIVHGHPNELAIVEALVANLAGQAQ